MYVCTVIRPLFSVDCVGSTFIPRFEGRECVGAAGPPDTNLDVSPHREEIGLKWRIRCRLYNKQTYFSPMSKTWKKQRKWIVFFQTTENLLSFFSSKEKYICYCERRKISFISIEQLVRVFCKYKINKQCIVQIL